MPEPGGGHLSWADPNQAHALVSRCGATLFQEGPAVEGDQQKTQTGRGQAGIRRGWTLPSTPVPGPATIRKMKTHTCCWHGKDKQLDDARPGRSCRKSHAYVSALGPRPWGQFGRICQNSPRASTSGGLRHETLEHREIIAQPGGEAT